MEKKIILPGGAGLVGQNLVARLKAKGYKNIVVLDKHQANLSVLKKYDPTPKFLNVLQFNKNTEHVYLFYQYIRSIYKSKKFLDLLNKPNYNLDNVNMCAFDIQF